MTTLEFLHRIPIFDALSDEELAQVDACCVEKEYAANERIFADGEKADYLYVVLEGRVDLRFEVPGKDSSPEDNITSVRQAQTFGWSALMQSPIYSLSAYCATAHCRVLQASRKCLLAVFEKDPRMGYTVMGNVAEVIRMRFHQLQEELSRRKGRQPARW
ncbi:MAG: cyclic nucleotide-binding domain-containing protein [Thermodesulfobacteriota bacterium]